MDEVPMGAVNFHELESSLEAAASRFAESPDDARDAFGS
jgi:hypothetical protein